MELRKQCQQFAVDLLHQSRSSQELAFILNHDPDSPPYEEGEHMKLARLELAIQYKQKKVFFINIKVKIHCFIVCSSSKHPTTFSCYMV